MVKNYNPSRRQTCDIEPSADQNLKKEKIMKKTKFKDTPSSKLSSSPGSASLKQQEIQKFKNLQKKVKDSIKAHEIDLLK